MNIFSRRKMLYEGKAKIIYEGTEPGTYIQYFKDDATAGNGAKKDILAGKGVDISDVTLDERLAHFLVEAQAQIENQG